MTAPLTTLALSLALIAPALAHGRDAVQLPRQAPDGALIDLSPHAGPGLAPGAPGASADTTGPWQPSVVPPGLFLRAISMSSPQIGYAAGELGVVLKTVDGGATWTFVKNDGYPIYWYGVQATTAQSVVVAGFDNQSGAGIVCWSENGGASWGPLLTLPGPSQGVAWLERVEFANVSDGLVTAGWGGGVHATQNGGRTVGDWNYHQVSGGWLLGSFTYLSDDRAWIAGIDQAFSPDSGSTWSTSAGSSAIFDGPVAVHNNGLGLIGGGTISPSVQGWIHRTTNAGHDWTPSPVASTPYPVRAIDVFDLERAWAVGGDHFSGVGGVWGTGDGGVTWGLEQDVGGELHDVECVRVDSGSVLVLAAGSVSQIWRRTVDAPVDAGLVGTSYGFCDWASAPCGNPFDSSGCMNLTGLGAFLAGSGTSSTSADDLVLTTTQLPPDKLGLLFMGAGQQESPLGNGLLVVASANLGLHRFQPKFTGPTGTIAEGPGIVAYSNAHFPVAAAIQPGQTWNFQCYYRDPTGPCGSTYNTSNGFTVAFLP